MSKSKPELTKLIQWKTYQLPDWLFHCSPVRRKFTSPAAGFNPATALSGNPWQSTSTPSSVPSYALKPKSIVLTIGIFKKQQTREEWLALIHWWEQLEFTIYLCTQNEDSTVSIIPAKDLSGLDGEGSLHHALNCLTSFNEDDYKTMASQHHCERLQIVVIDSSNILSFHLCLLPETLYINQDELLEINSFMALRPGPLVFLPQESQQYVGRKQLIETPDLLLRLRQEIIDNPALTKKIKLSSLLQNYPDQSIELIHKHASFISNLSDLTSCIMASPEHVLILMKLALDNESLWTQENTKDDKPFYGLNSSLINQVIDCLMKKPERIQSAELVAFIILHAPVHAQLLMKSKWDIMRDEVSYEQFFGAFPDYIEELLTELLKTRKNGFNLAELIQLFPERATELLQRYEDSIKSEAALSACITACPPDVGKKLFNRHVNMIGRLMSIHHPKLTAQYLMRNKIQISDGWMLAASLKTFPNQTKALLQDHSSKIETSGQLSLCLSYITHPDDITNLLVNQMGHFTPAEMLAAVSKQAPRHFYWLAERLQSSPIFSDDSDFLLFTIRVPERLEWAMQRYNPDRKTLSSFYERHRKYVITARLFPSAPENESTFLLPCRAEQRNEFPLQDITYLYISTSDELNYLTALAEQGKLLQLVVAEITIYQNNIEELFPFLRALEINCPHLKRLLLPKELEGLSLNLRTPVNYQDSGAPPENKLAHEDKDYQTHPHAKANHFYVANNGLVEDSSTNINSAPTYNMVNTGELLNPKGQSLPRLRTGLIELSDDLSKLRHTTPTLTEIAKPRQLSQADINQYWNKSGNVCCCLFKTTLNPATPIRLMSVDAQEKLQGIRTASSKDNIRVFRGDDDFFYALSTTRCDMEYLIEADSALIQQQKLLVFPQHDPILQYVKTYQSKPDKGERIPSIHQKTRAEWLEALFHEKGGTCSHRCQAVWYAVSKNPDLKKRIRMVDIDNNHVRIEIHNEQENTWHQIDLGGLEARLNYDEKNQLTNQPISTRENPVPENTNKHARPSAQNEESCNQVDSQETPLRHELYQHNKIKTIHRIADIRTKVFHNAVSSCLIISKDIETQAMLILEQAKKSNIPIFYLDKPGNYGSGEPQIRIDQNGEPEISYLDDLDVFLKAIKGYPQAKILINWEAFSPHQRVALNTIIDQSKKSVYGKRMPASLRVISLCAQLPKDESFLSRHPKKFNSHLTAKKIHLPKAKTTKTIDIRGYADWKTQLFGPIILDNNHLGWQKSQLTKLLIGGKEKEGRIHLTIKNLPAGAEADFMNMVRQAQAEGFFRYYGYAIEYPDCLGIEYQQVPFSFSAFPAVAIYTDICADQLLPDFCPVINSALFDYLLINKTVNDGQFKQVPGLLEQHSKQKLALFITSPLSTTQWYCLFAEAQEQEVALELYLAPDIHLPEDLKTIHQPFPEKKTTTISNHVHVTEQAEKLAAHLARQCDAICIAVEDYSYQDLVNRIDYRYDDFTCRFTDFKEKQSALIKSLEEGKQVIIHGQFTQALVEAFSPLLLKSWPGRLTLIIEKKLVDKNNLAQSYPGLSFLPLEACTYHLQEKSLPLITPLIWKEDAIDFDPDRLDLSHSAREAEVFIQKRQALFMDIIKEHRMVQLIGHTGVGKSHLIKELKETRSDTLEIYHELAQLDAWASDSSDKMKILFIDESNIDDLHLTRFSPMKTNPASTILGDNGLYQLTEKHCIALARNPHDYGGGRAPQKLFEDGDIPELHLEDLPPVFIYERMLKPLASFIDCTDIDFKEASHALLSAYQNQKQVDPLSVNVRRLQEDLLTTFINREEVLLSLKQSAQKADFNPHFIGTPSTKTLQNALAMFIVNRQKTPVGTGLNAFIIEGRPGMGKTECIGDTLSRMGYQPSDSPHNNTRVYLKIDASLPLPKLIEQLTYAFVHGIPAWIDEGNSCMNEGLEKPINSLLSGIHPLTGECSGQPGFMLFITANSIGLAGRSKLSPALLGRSIVTAMPEPSLEDINIILTKTLGPQLCTITNTDKMAQHIHEEFKENPNLSLREITPRLASVAEKYPFSIPLIQARIGEAIDKKDIEFVRFILNHKAYKQESNLISQNLLNQAASQGQLEMVQLFIKQSALFSKKMRLETAKIAGKAGHENIAVWLKNSCTPPKYHLVWNTRPSDNNFEKAKELLKNYSSPYRFFQGHWRRHHVDEINNLLNTATNMQELRDGLQEISQSSPKGFNLTGSLARRIFYIEKTCEEDAASGYTITSS